MKENRRKEKTIKNGGKGFYEGAGNELNMRFMLMPLQVSFIEVVYRNHKLRLKIVMKL